jgi:pseudouridylate synthase
MSDGAIRPIHAVLIQDRPMQSCVFTYGPEMQHANQRKVPIVFLESTAIAHGLPWPDNLETAQAMEEAVRACGAVAATLAVFEGVARIGLSAAELEQLARSAARQSADDPANERAHQKPRFYKANRRDLGAAIAQRRFASTTVSATLWLAQRSGLKPCIMATGGLGGVHRDAAQSFDVSTDLDELARADGSMLVCSGFKSILDLTATLEALETRGVAIAGYRTAELPGFLSVTSGLPLEHTVETPAEAADLLRTHRLLGLPGALVLTNPVPDADALSRESLDSALETAFREARQRNLTGKAITPFLLDIIRQQTQGQSLRANKALLVANAALAAQIAVELARHSQDGD